MAQAAPDECGIKVAVPAQVEKRLKYRGARPSALMCLQFIVPPAQVAELKTAARIPNSRNSILTAPS